MNRSSLRSGYLLKQHPLLEVAPRIRPRDVVLAAFLHVFDQAVPLADVVWNFVGGIARERILGILQDPTARDGHIERLGHFVAIHEHVETHALVEGREDLDAGQREILVSALEVIPGQILDHLQKQSGLRSRPDEGEDEPAVGQMRLQIEVQVHVGVTDGADGLDVIQTEALGNLAEIGRGHRIEEPRHHLLDCGYLLLGELMDLLILKDIYETA